MMSLALRYPNVTPLYSRAQSAQPPVTFHAQYKRTLITLIRISSEGIHQLPEAGRIHSSRAPAAIIGERCIVPGRHDNEKRPIRGNDPQGRL